MGESDRWMGTGRYKDYRVAGVTADTEPAGAGGGGGGEVVTMEKIYYRLIELEERVYQLEHPEEFVGKTKRGRDSSGK